MVAARYTPDIRIFGLLWGFPAPILLAFLLNRILSSGIKQKIQLKYATIIISSVPLMILYPFFQKYFDNGIMAGAVKG